MASHLGVDWAGSCWVVVKTGDERLITTEPSILNVWHEHGEADDVQSILVDIPIGLPEIGPRACDEEASERLGNRGRSVFLIPGREVVETDSYERARELNNNTLGSQSWWLFPRIREVDVFLQEYPVAKEKVYESHPEICFSEFANDVSSSKATDEGLEERLEVLREDRALYDEVKSIVTDRQDGAEWHRRISKGKLDDVVDAAILALTGKKLGLGPRSDGGEYPSLPEQIESEKDEVIGIPPEIVYPRSG